VPHAEHQARDEGEKETHDRASVTTVVNETGSRLGFIGRDFFGLRDNASIAEQKIESDTR